MRTLGNILWHFPFLGFLRAIANYIGGAVMCLTIIFIPVGLGMFQIGKFQFLPFDRALVTRKDLALATGEQYRPGGFMRVLNVIARILYFIPGCAAFLSGAGVMIGEFCSLIGIPAGLVEMRTLFSYFNPINKVCVPIEVETLIKTRKAQANVSRYTGTETRPAADAATEAVRGFDDSKLQEIVRNKQIYSADIVAAAEKEVLARIAGTNEPGAVEVEITETVTPAGTFVTETVTTAHAAAPTNDWTSSYAQPEQGDFGKRIGDVLGKYWEPWCMLGGIFLIQLIQVLPQFTVSTTLNIILNLAGIAAFLTGLINLASKLKGQNRIFLAAAGGIILLDLLISTLYMLNWSAYWRSGEMFLSYTSLSALGWVSCILTLIMVGVIAGFAATSKNLLSQAGAGIVAIPWFIAFVRWILSLCGVSLLSGAFNTIFAILFLILATAGWAAIGIGCVEEVQGKYPAKPLLK